MGALSVFVKLTTLATVSAVALIAFLAYLPLIDIKPQSYRLQRPPQFVGPLAENDILSRAEHLFENELMGPESVIQHEGAIYTPTSDGRLVKVQGGKYETVANFGGDCRAEGIWEQNKCGRGLGLRFDKKGDLYAIDCYFGIKKINVKTGQVTTEFDMTKTPIEGAKSKFFDDMVIDEDAGTNGGHVFYISDASSRWDIDIPVGITAEHESTGRLLKYDAGSKKMTVLVKNIGFANGVELTDDKTGVIYSELNKRRLMIHYIRGPKKGRTELFLDNLPGEPDNIRRSTSKEETYWVAIFSGRNGSHPHFFLDDLQEKPHIRKAIALIVHNVGAGFTWAGNTFNFAPLKEIGHNLKSGYTFAKIIVGRGLIIEFSRAGKVLRAFHSPDKSTTALSEVREVLEDGKKVLYLGSYYNSYLGRLVIPN